MHGGMECRKRRFRCQRDVASERRCSCNIHHHASLVRQYYFSGPLVDVATQVIGPNIKAATSQLTFKMRGNNQSFAWHQDNSYGELDPYNAISCLTALDDADQENGCLWLVPGSHKQGQVREGYTPDDIKQRKPVELEVDDALAWPMPLRAGECLFFHCHMLHKSEGQPLHGPGPADSLHAVCRCRCRGSVQRSAAPPRSARAWHNPVR